MNDLTTYSIPEFPTVGDLKSARLALGLSQSDIAREMGVSDKTVSHYENEAREISLSRARDYAEALREAAHAN